MNGDPTFYRSPTAAVAAPPEQLAYVAAFDPAGTQNDAMTVVDCDAGSSSYGEVIGWTDFPSAGNELHHFGWNACSSALCHKGHDHHGTLERRYLIVPGLRSSRTYVLDTKPDPLQPQVVRTIEAEELAAKAGYSRPHTVHCGPGGIFMSNLGGANVADLSASVWLWHRDNGRWTAKKVITIPAEPAAASELPPALQPFGAVPPLVSDIDLSVDDRWLYVSCWGTGELKQYDVSDPHNPKEAGSVHLGGIVRRAPHAAVPELQLAGGPQMVEISRDGQRVYATNSLYASWDDIFYPDGVGAWMARMDADTEAGGMTVDRRFFPHDDDFRGLRVHQTRLQGGDASSDSYCFVE